MRKLLAVALALSAPLALADRAPAHPEGLAVGLGESSAMWEILCGDPEPDACATSGQGGSPVKSEPGRGQGLTLVKHVPKTGLTNTNSDLAFWGSYAIQGNYDGLNIWDISQPADPKLTGQVRCPGAQNDVSVYRNLIITSTDSPRVGEGCDPASSQAGQSSLPTSWEGIRIWDWSNPASPTVIKNVRTDCGSHTHTLVPDLAGGRLYVYVSSYSPSTLAYYCKPPHDKISIVEIPLADPSAAAVVQHDPPLAPLFPDGGQPSTSGCHDITAYPAIGLAAGACMGEGVIMDISDPARPQTIATVTDPNFSFWHSATFSNDGRTVVFTDEWGGGSAARCKETDSPLRGTDAFYDISDPRNPVYLNRFKIPRHQTAQENCVSHNGSLIPLPGRDLLVQAWYQGGTSIIEFTDPMNIKEIAYFDRGPVNTGSLVLGGHWSSYWYNGKIYASEIARGFDVLQATWGDTRVKQAYLNVQTQEPLRP